MPTLTLQIKWYWLDLILKGEKTSEYRIATDRLLSWLEKHGDPDKIKFTNGYRPNRPTVIIEVKDVIIWHDEDDEDCTLPPVEVEFELGGLLEHVDLPEDAVVNIMKQIPKKRG